MSVCMENPHWLRLYEVLPVLDGPEIRCAELEGYLAAVGHNIEHPDTAHLVEFFQTCDWCPAVGHNRAMWTEHCPDDGTSKTYCWQCWQRRLTVEPLVPIAENADE